MGGGFRNHLDENEHLRNLCIHCLNISCRKIHTKRHHIILHIFADFFPGEDPGLLERVTLAPVSTRSARSCLGTFGTSPTSLLLLSSFRLPGYLADLYWISWLYWSRLHILRGTHSRPFGCLIAPSVIKEWSATRAISCHPSLVYVVYDVCRRVVLSSICTAFLDPRLCHKDEVWKFICFNIPDSKNK